MNSLSKIMARDIMKTDVVRLAPTDTLESAIESFEDMHISGAPVVDGTGRLIGVLSTSDINTLESARASQASVGRERVGAVSSVGDELSEEGWSEDSFAVKDDEDDENPGRVMVAERMSRTVIKVAPDESLKGVCRVLSREGIHRVMVVEKGALCGIITTSDVVRCLANAL